MWLTPQCCIKYQLFLYDTVKLNYTLANVLMPQVTGALAPLLVQAGNTYDFFRLALFLRRLCIQEKCSGCRHDRCGYKKNVVHDGRSRSKNNIFLIYMTVVSSATTFFLNSRRSCLHRINFSYIHDCRANF